MPKAPGPPNAVSEAGGGGAKPRPIRVGEAITLRSGRSHTLVLEQPKRFRLELPIDPEHHDAVDDVVTLEGSGGYSKTLGVVAEGRRHAHRQGYTTLVFEGVKTGVKYTCTVDPKSGGRPYKLFIGRELVEAEDPWLVLPSAAKPPAPSPAAPPPPPPESKKKEEEKPKSFRLELPIDPEHHDAVDDVVTLEGSDGYSKTLGVVAEGKRHAHRQGYTTLVFEGVKTGVQYTCTVDPKSGGRPYKLFIGRELVEAEGPWLVLRGAGGTSK